MAPPRARWRRYTSRKSPLADRHGRTPRSSRTLPPVFPGSRWRCSSPPPPTSSPVHCRARQAPRRHRTFLGVVAYLLQRPSPRRCMDNPGSFRAPRALRGARRVQRRFVCVRARAFVLVLSVSCAAGFVLGGLMTLGSALIGEPGTPERGASRLLATVFALASTRPVLAHSDGASLSRFLINAAGTCRRAALRVSARPPRREGPFRPRRRRRVLVCIATGRRSCSRSSSASPIRVDALPMATLVATTSWVVALRVGAPPSEPCHSSRS